LIDNLESVELNDFKEVIIQLTRAENDVEPDSRLKTELLQQFKKTKQTTQNKPATEQSVSSKSYFLKVAAAVLVLFGLGATLYFINSKSTDEAAVHIETDEFNQFTQIDQVVNEEDTMASETKFLMSMDFFSNSSVSLNYK
tara:strand:+ start:14824 stop:15246 length:423 start_codon:yes stop_codon:yes gene_type:complete